MNTFSELDREVTLSILRLEDATHDFPNEAFIKKFRLLWEDGDHLADALFSLWSQNKERKPIWEKSIIRLYRLLIEIFQMLLEGMPEGNEAELSFINPYAALYIASVISPNLSACLILLKGEEKQRIEAVIEKLSYLQWGLETLI